ncbi:DUF5677 domain-containing protein [Priestia aryabhattai]
MAVGKYSSQLESLSQCIVFGDHLYNEIVKNENLTLQKTVILGLYKDLLKKIDSCFILADHESITGLKNITRAAFETHIGLVYMLQEEGKIEERALSYWVVHNKSEIKYANMGLKDKSHSKELKNTLKQSLKRAEIFLSEEIVQEVVREWEVTKDKINRNNRHKNYDPKWYSLFEGPVTLTALIYQIGGDLQKRVPSHIHLDMIKNKYKYLYELLSIEAHSYSALTGINPVDKLSLSTTLRGGNADLFTNLAKMFFLDATNLLLKLIFPSYQTAFKNFCVGNDLKSFK